VFRAVTKIETTTFGNSYRKSKKIFEFCTVWGIEK